MATSLGAQTHYLSLQPQTGAGSLPGGQFAQFNGRFNRVGWAYLDQTNDYSFSSTGVYQDWTKITVYLDGALVWGQEPSSGGFFAARAGGGKGVGDIPATTSINVVPNPVRREAWLVLHLAGPGAATVMVTDVLGQIVHVEDLGYLDAGTQKRRLDLEALASGLYIAALQVKGPEGSKVISTFKLAIAR